MRSILAVCLLGLSSAAAAAEGELSGYYAGFGVGQIQLQADSGGLTFDGDDTAWQLLMGYRITPNFSVEGAYLSGGKVTDTVAGIPITIESDAFIGSLIGTVPLSEQFGLHGRVGFLRWDSDTRGNGQSIDDNGTDPIFGGGMSLRVKNSLFRFDYQRADVEDTDAELFTLSVMILI